MSGHGNSLVIVALVCSGITQSNLLSTVSVCVCDLITVFCAQNKLVGEIKIKKQNKTSTHRDGQILQHH